jgi:hypothetical protein
MSGLLSSDLVTTRRGTFQLWVTYPKSQSVTGVLEKAGDRKESQPEQVFTAIEIVDQTADHREPCVDFNKAPSITEMATLFTRAEDTTKQDIVQLRNISDQSTTQLSWLKLIKILEVDDGVGLGFVKGRDFLVFNSRICVRDKRQFFACLQYLHNLETLSLEAFVHSPQVGTLKLAECLGIIIYIGLLRCLSSGLLASAQRPHGWPIKEEIWT